TAGLREWAATFSAEQMSSKGEAQLLAAVRAERRRAPVTRSARLPVRWAAAAALMIILMALAALRFVEWRKPQAVVGNLPTPQTELSPSPAVDQPSAHTPSAPPHRQAVASPRSAANMASAKGSRKPQDTASLATTQAVDAAPAAASDDAPASEIATAFIPLAGGRSFAPADSLQLMRVE